MQNQAENGKKYTGWAVYHASNRPTWQYKKAGGVFYYRSIKNLKAKEVTNGSSTMQSSTRDIIFKHSIVFLLDSLNLSEADWLKMEERRASHRAVCVLEKCLYFFN